MTYIRGVQGWTYFLLIFFLFFIPRGLDLQAFNYILVCILRYHRQKFKVSDPWECQEVENK